jgi:Antitoxin-like ribbon-helix-helix
MLSLFHYQCQAFSLLLKSTQPYGILAGMEKRRTYYNTTLQDDLLKQLKILAVEQETRQNDLLEEAIRDLLAKYGKKVPTGSDG